MNAKIVELFRSIQGEGRYIGLPQVFVRFFECNMHCHWCDTPASIGDNQRHYQDIGLEDLLREVSGLYGKDTHSVSLTGGEPLLQGEFLKVFCRNLKKKGMKVYLDTNGTLPTALKGLIRYVDIVAMDLKLPSSTKQKEFWTQHRDFLKIARKKEVFIKAVITTDTDPQDVIKAAKLVASIDPKLLFILQPNYLEIKKGLIGQCLEHQKSCAKFLKDVRILPQVHKFMKIR